VSTCRKDFVIFIPDIYVSFKELLCLPREVPWEELKLFLLKLEMFGQQQYARDRTERYDRMLIKLTPQYSILSNPVHHSK